MVRSMRLIMLPLALGLSSGIAGAAGSDSLQATAARLTAEFRARLPIYVAGVSAVVRSGRTTDKPAMDSLTGQVRRLARLLAERDSLLLAAPGDGWALVAGLEDDLTLADAVHPHPAPLVLLALEQYRDQFRVAALRPADTIAMAQQALGRVRTALALWRQRIDEKLWPSLQVALRDGGASTNAFTDGDSFASAMTAFFESRISASSDKRSQDEFRRFSSLWTTALRPEWLPALVQGGRIRSEEAGALNRLFDRWSSAMAPWIWSETLLGAIGVLLLFAAIAVIYYWRTKRPPKP